MRSPLLSAVLICSLALPCFHAAAETNYLGRAGLAPSDRCAELVKECYANGTSEKSSCFHVSSQHPFCADTELGLLVGKRWTMSPQTDFRDAPPALTGPQFVDGSCIANFDSQLSGHLIGGTLSREATRHLETTLDGCAKAPANEIFRP